MNENTLEQPNLDTENNQIDDSTSSENQEGSMIGKFKDAKTLLDAYNNLQAEFTRKSQKLAEFQKEYEENANFKTYNSLDDFIKDTSDSDKYKNEISEILVKDNELNNLPNKYQVAYKLIKNAESKLADNLNSQEFLDKYILNNENIKTQIINNYLSTLNNISPAPKVISSNSTNIHFSPNTSKPKTLKEAGEIFSKMLN
ncbi:MAG: hypothetical protein IJA23_05595 [Clostridia bacterium]|nr:hypothetical protein [Clostridia bacterium]